MLPPFPIHAKAGDSPWSPFRVGLTYAWRHRRLGDFDAPTRFTELMQQRKLTDRDPRFAPLSDKVAAKLQVAARIGAEWVIPTLWHGTTLPARPPWPRPFVVKSRHGCNQRAFVRTGGEDWEAIRRKALLWVRRTYGGWLDEWLYAGIPHGVLVEPFIGTGGRLPVDYKLFVFGGRAEYIQVHLDREGAHRWIVLDRAWQRVSSASGDADPAPPFALTAMIAAAEELGRDFDFVRIDFYEVERTPLFGEMTFYPGSGLYPFDPPALDLEMGAHWLRARGRQRRDLADGLNQSLSDIPCKAAVR